MKLINKFQSPNFNNRKSNQIKFIVIHYTALENCKKMLTYTFQTQVGPYYDKIIDFDVDKPEEVKVMYAGCDKTGRTPENNSNDWKIVPNVDPEILYPEIKEKGTSI